MSSDASGPAETFALRGRPPAISLEPQGFHHPRSSRGRGTAYTLYRDITHLASSSWAVWIGTRRSVYVLTRAAFVDPHGPENLVRALLGRIAHQPGGAEQLARMAEIEETSRSAGPLRATWGLAILCLIVFALQLALGPEVHEVGYYSPQLVAAGDWWRLVTANLLHAFPRFPLHLVLNLLALVALGTLAERALGSARTVCVMGLSGLAAMAASGLTSETDVVGVSGVVFGLAGAVTWLEFCAADRMPAWWRIPRRALVLLLVLNAGLAVVVPLIAWAAHLGGFLAGVAATAVLTGRSVARRPSPAWVRGGAAAVIVLCAAAVGNAGQALFGAGDFAARHAARLAELPGVPPAELNNRAWMIAVAPHSSRKRLEAALALAQRAVEETHHEDPTALDTLAEVLFQLGRRDEAVATIDEAIAHAPGQDYYVEQRRRFTGQRAPDDRPDPPMPWTPGPQPDRPAQEPGVTV